MRGAAFYLGFLLTGCAVDDPADTAAPADSDAGLPDSDPGSLDSDAAETDEAESPADSDEDNDLPPASPFNGCTNPDGQKAAGTAAAPRLVATFPFTDADTTIGAPDDAIDAYSCAADKSERGPERWYRFELTETREVRIEVADGTGVDIDVHLLRDPTVSDGLATGCIARNDKAIVQSLEAGTYWVVADTFASSSGTEYPGAYTLGVEAWIDGAWVEVPLGDGAVWRHRQTSGSKPQRQDVLVLDPARVAIAPVRHDGCETVGHVASTEGAKFGINAAFYDSGCDPRTFLRIDGETLYRPELGAGERAALWNDYETPIFRWLDDGGDATDVAHGIGSYPSMVTDGEALVEPLGTADFTVGRHPRTGFGVLDDGRVAWVVVDGRSSTASGLSLPDFADLMVEVGVVDGVNLDGGGSSTLYIEGCSVTGVVNFPSDGGGDDHGGWRSVADGVYGWGR